MKIIRRQLERDNSGTLTVLPQDSEDMWYVYNIIQENDEIETMTTRKLVSEKGTPRVRLKLRIRVNKVEYDGQGSIIRINGKTTKDHKDVTLGSFHTLQLEPGLSFELYKDEWDSFALQQVDDATNIENRSDIAAVVLQPGVAHVCLVTEAMTILRQKVELTIPRKKRGDNTAQDKAMERFFSQVYSAVAQDINLDKIKVVLIAGPGSTPQQCYDFIFQKAQSGDRAQLVKSRAKFIVAHASSGYLHGLTEALENPQVQSSLADTRYGREMKIMDEFYKSLNDDDLKAWYGVEEVERAVRMNAVDVLMVTDSLFRSNDVVERKRFVALCDEVRDQGREVLVLSSLHPSGEQLDNMTGVACLLMYPLDLDEVEEDEE